MVITDRQILIILAVIGCVILAIKAIAIWLDGRRQWREHMDALHDGATAQRLIDISRQCAQQFQELREQAELDYIAQLKAIIARSNCFQVRVERPCEREEKDDTGIGKRGAT